ncbi:hypothetical protein ACHAPJ_002744 [Fusarium lateritium]
MASANEVAMQHRTLPSQDFPGQFSMPFPGLQPTINQRREYMRTFCQWYYMGQDFESQEREERHGAQLCVAEVLIEAGITSCRVSYFEWRVDRLFWACWLFQSTVCQTTNFLSGHGQILQSRQLEKDAPGLSSA